MGEEFSASSVATLYLVADQYGAVALTGLCQSLSELRRSHLDTAHTLDALQDDGCDTTLRQFINPGLQIVQWQVTHMVIVVDRSNDLRIVRHLNCQ